MNKSIGPIVATGVALISSPEVSIAEQVTTLTDLAARGFNSEFITAKFNEAQVNIDWNETLKIRSEDEGKKIRLETLDHFSVVMPIESAAGVPNKVFSDF